MDGNTEAPAGLPSLLEQIKDAKSIVEFDKVEAGLQELESKYSGVVYSDIGTKDGLARAKADRAAVREVRYTVATLASDMKDPLNRLKKLIDGGADRIKTRVLKIEEPIDAQIKAEEARIEAEKERKKAEAEALRKARQDKIDAMRNAPVAMTGQPAAKIAETLAEIQAREVTLDEFGELAGSAMTAQAAAIAALGAMHAAAIAAEQQAVELAQLRAEAEARRKVEEAEAAGRAAKEAAERRDREVAEQKAREEAAQAATAMAVAQKAQLDAERAERAKADAELAELRAKLAAMQAAVEPPKPMMVPMIAGQFVVDASKMAGGWDDATRNAVLRQEAEVATVAERIAEVGVKTDVLVLSEGFTTAVAVAESMQPYSRDSVIDLIANSWFLTAGEAEALLVELFGGAK